MLRKVVSAKFVKATLAKKNAQRGIVVVEAVKQTKPVLAGVDFEALEAAHAIIRRDEIHLRAGWHAILACERLHECRSHSTLKLSQIGIGAELARSVCAHEGSGSL